MKLILAGVTAGALTLLASASSVAHEHPADLCLEVAAESVSVEEWDAVAAAAGVAVAQRPALFPAPTVSQEATRLDVDSGHLEQTGDHGSCLEPGFEWTARFGRGFLEAGADLMLAEAPTTPGIDSDVTIEWYPHETRMRTALEFAGPLDIPNGRCWIDDTFTVDDATGTVLASGDEGVKTSPFAEGACGRFFDHLPLGGAGEQAVTLLPTVVTLADGGALRFVAEKVAVTEDAVSVFGRLARD